MTWATHSTPTLVVRTCWNGVVALSTAGLICCAIVRATKRRNTSPTTISQILLAETRTGPRCSEIIPERPAAAPRLAHLRFLRNRSRSNSNFKRACLPGATGSPSNAARPEYILQVPPTPAHAPPCARKSQCVFRDADTWTPMPPRQQTCCRHWERFRQAARHRINAETSTSRLRNPSLDAGLGTMSSTGVGSSGIAFPCDAFQNVTEFRLDVVLGATSHHTALLSGTSPILARGLCSTFSRAYSCPSFLACNGSPASVPDGTAHHPTTFWMGPLFLPCLVSPEALLSIFPTCA